ncbi:sec14 [Symbiodinium sp. CCMP2456]|nr:sec14 [Symbiodinium sp. CCMP2456]
MTVQVCLLDFPWVLDYILATRFNCSLRQIRHAVCSIVLTLRTILSAAVELGILVSQDSDSDGAVSAKPFIDNMIHVIRECLKNFPLCLDSEFFHSFLEPLPSHLRFLCGNFHPLTHMQFEDSAKQKAFEAQTKAITQALSELPSQCSNLELHMSSQEPVLKQIQLIKEHLRAPLWMLMHDFRSLQGEEKLLVEDVRQAVRATAELQARETGELPSWPQVLGDTLLLLLPLWKLSALAVAKGQEALTHFVAGPPLGANLGAQRLLRRLIEVLLSEKADFMDIALWFAAEPSSAALLTSGEAVHFLLPEAANDDEFASFRKEGLMRTQDNLAYLQGHLLRLPKHLRVHVSAYWRKAVEEVHLYLQLYLRVIEAFLEVQKEAGAYDGMPKHTLSAMSYALSKATADTACKLQGKLRLEMPKKSKASKNATGAYRVKLRVPFEQRLVRYASAGCKGPVMDGFRTVEEPAYLSIKEENIAPFTLPVEAFTFEPEPDMVVSHFKNGDTERKIYCNIELSEEEKASVKALQETAKAQGLEFFPSIAIMAGRFLSRARGDPHKAIKLMLATQEWKAEYFKAGPVSDHQVIDDLKYGVVYFCGRDYGMRPTIVCRANRIPDEWYKDKAAGIERLIRVLIFSMEYMVRYMVVPGKIENNCLVVDLKGLGISGVPISALSKIYSVMSHHYIGRVFRFYVVNMSSGLSTIAGWVKGLLTDRQKQKLQLLDNLDDLKKDFANHQLEEDLGGTRPLIKTFFPFPLQGPPFDKGSTESCTAKPLEGTHKLLTTMGARGRIWDPTKTKEENAALEYAPEAYDFFVQNELPVPPDCQKQHEAAKQAEEEAKRAAAESPSGITNSDMKASNDGANPDMLTAPGALPDEEEDDDEEEEEEACSPDSLAAAVIYIGSSFRSPECDRSAGHHRPGSSSYQA